MKTIASIKNELLDRDELVIEVLFDKATPSKKEIIEKIAHAYGKDLVAVKHIYTDFGARKAKVIVNIYNNPDTFKKLETKKAPKKKEEKKQQGK